jgi:phosphoribosylanthranilate isomerase
VAAKLSPAVLPAPRTAQGAIYTTYQMDYMIIQIYAFTHINEAISAAEMGVNHIGFVAGDYGLVPGELGLREARRLSDALSGKAVRVALTMAVEVEEILRMAEAVRPDVVHISTDLEAVGLEALGMLRRRLPGTIRLMKAIHIADERNITDALRFAPVSDILLLDTKVAGMPGIGATGRTHDWGISRRIVESVEVPVILAGGLTSHNVQQAIRAVRPWGVDSNTATNLPGSPVEKDMERVRIFVQAARAAANSWDQKYDRDSETT